MRTQQGGHVERNSAEGRNRLRFPRASCRKLKPSPTQSMEFKLLSAAHDETSLFTPEKSRAWLLELVGLVSEAFSPAGCTNAGAKSFFCFIMFGDILDYICIGRIRGKCWYYSGFYSAHLNLSFARGLLEESPVHKIKVDFSTSRRQVGFE